MILHKNNDWGKFLLGVFAGAAIVYTVKKYMCNKSLREVFKSLPTTSNMDRSPQR